MSARDSDIPRSGAKKNSREPSAKTPSSFMAPVRRSSAIRSTSPEPQMPWGSAPPIVDTLAGPVLQHHALDRAVVARHAVGDLPALEGRPRRARRGHHAVPVPDDDLRVRAHVDQHERIVGLVHADGEQVGRHVGADVAADERR